MNTNSVKKANLFFLMLFFIVFIGPILLFKINEYVGLQGYQVQIIYQYSCILLPSILFLKFNKQPIKENLRLNKLNLKSILMILLIVLCSYPIIAFLSYISNSLFKNYTVEFIGSLPEMPFLLFLFLIAITPAICEEVAMRGVIFSNCRNISLFKAAILNGFLFGMLHMNINQFIYAFGLGIIMTYIVYATNSIFASMIMHFIVNGFAATVSYALKSVSPDLMETAMDASKASDVFNFNSLLILFAVATICTFIVIKLIGTLAEINNRSLKGSFRKDIYVTQSDVEQSVYTEETSISEKRIITIPLILSILGFIYIAVFGRIL